MGVLALAIWAHLPYLQVEYRRLQPWKIAGLLIGDCVGLIWFARFAFVHAVLARQAIPVAFEQVRSGFKPVAVAVGIAVFLDLSFTLYLMADERMAYQQGKTTEARVISVQERKRELATWYELECSFTNEFGIREQVHLRINAKNHEMPAALQPSAAAVVREGRGNIQIRYDPKFPARAWIDGLGWEDEDGIYWFSLAVLFFQSILLGLFLLCLKGFSLRGCLPWWWDIYKVIPLAVEAFWMLVIGLIDRWIDHG